MTGPRRSANAVPVQGRRPITSVATNERSCDGLSDETSDFARGSAKKRAFWRPVDRPESWGGQSQRSNSAAEERGAAEGPPLADQLQPLVEPQVSHFRQVPLRTSVKFWHSRQASPS